MKSAKNPVLWLLAALVAVGVAAAVFWWPERQNTGVETRTQAVAEGWPRTLTHKAGTLTLATPPKHIVSTTPSLTGILLAIDAPVTASAATTPGGLTDGKGFFSQWAGVADQRGVTVLYPKLQFDLEAVIAAAPDLVIVSASGGDSAAEHYAELEAQGIPTLVVDYANQSWQDTATFLGRATGLEDKASAAIDRFNAYAAEVAATLTPPGDTVSIVGYNVGGSYSIGRTESAQGQILTALGFKVAGLPPELAPQVTRSTDFDFISRENLPAAISGKTVFLLRGSEADVRAFLSDPVLANHPAVISRQVYPLGANSFRIDYYSGREMIDTVAPYFRKPS